jgi:alanyl-tRNA synthetase
MTGHQIRQGFLDYFARHGHRVVSSSSLVPTDDPTLLFTNAGMNQFKDLFLGRERRDYTRATTVQKCMRVSGKHNDLDNVGPSLRHHTFFEMLGNFSFGDYFKKDAIPFAWQLLTNVWGLAPDRLFPTVFKGEAGIPRDTEAFEIWTSLVPQDRIRELGLAENFWQMGDTGPCGRCSEIHYFRGPGVACDQPVCLGVECSCERYVEVWNNVFMEFDRADGGALSPLPAPSIDTGMGLERIAAVIQDKPSNYDTDLFTPILDAIGARCGRGYSAAAGPIDHPDVSMRVVADHLRAMTFLIADGVLPSNEWRGYVLRKIMRRAMRHGKKLGLTEPFLHALVDVVVHEMGHAYPELARGRDAIVRTIHAEEDRFDAVLTAGLPRLEEILDRAAASGHTVVPGDAVFRLYDSLGVPLDFAEDLASQRGLTVDRAAFDDAMEAQRERARAGSTFEARKGATFTYVDDAERARVEHTPDRFEGYETTEVEGARIVAVFDEHRVQIRALPAGATGYVVLDRTPFYVEAGGQVSDTGALITDGVRSDVRAMTRLTPAGARAHLVTAGSLLSSGLRVAAVVDINARNATRRNHTATHLLHAALRRRLGSHVRQAGSLVAPDRLRFDFAHFQPISADDRREIERLVNEEIYRNIEVKTDLRPTDEAISDGAMALFGEKYGDTVRVVSVPGFSVELCGGTHVRATGDIGPFVITGESGIAAGVRRLEAFTGAGAIAYIQARDAALADTQAALNAPVAEMAEAVARLQAELKRLARENAQLRMKAAMGGSGQAEDDAVAIGDAKLIARRVTGLDKDALRSLSDSLRDRLKTGVVVLAAENDGRVQLLVSVTKDLTNRVKAGQLVKALAPIVGGGGGGRPDFAEAGGKDPSRIDEVLQTARALVSEALGGQ